jgi:hypothetical protein
MFLVAELDMMYVVAIPEVKTNGVLLYRLSILSLAPGKMASLPRQLQVYRYFCGQSSISFARTMVVGSPDKKAGDVIILCQFVGGRKGERESWNAENGHRKGDQSLFKI